MFQKSIQLAFGNSLSSSFPIIDSVLYFHLDLPNIFVSLY